MYMLMRAELSKRNKIEGLTREKAMKYWFDRIETAEDILKTIGRSDIPSTSVSIRQPAIDEETGEKLADYEIDFGKHELGPVEEGKLSDFMAGKAFTLKEKRRDDKA